MNKKALTLSIVIPVYNDQDYLKNCLQSIESQSVKPDEVIVVDNNCSDDSAKVAKSFPFVKLVSEKQQGVVHARNKGFDTAKSDIIGRIDADTRLPENWVQKIKEIFSAGEIDAVSGPVGWYDAPAKHLGILIDKNMRRIVWRLGERDNAVFLFGSNMAVSRKAWQDVKSDVCDRKDVHEDVDLALHLFERGWIIAFDDSLSAMTSSRRIDDSAAALKKYIDVYHNTYEVHGIRNPGIKLAMVVPMTAHFGVKLIKRAYDPQTERFSFKKFIESKPEARVQPMDPSSEADQG